MVRRTQRVPQFSQTTRLEVLKQLGETRSYINGLHAKVKPFSYDYGALSRVNDAIDDLAETWTGDRTHLHSKMHGSGMGRKVS